MQVAFDAVPENSGLPVPALRAINALVAKLNILSVLVARGAYDVQARAPLRPRAGMVAYADGTAWNPGSGEGLYVYKSDNQWHYLG